MIDGKKDNNQGDSWMDEQRNEEVESLWDEDEKWMDGERERGIKRLREVTNEMVEWSLDEEWNETAEIWMDIRDERMSRALKIRIVWVYI